MMFNMEEYKRFTVSLPKDLYDKFEAFRNKLGISRSDCIRKAMQSFMVSEENISLTSENVVGCISLIMRHEHFDSKHSHEINEGDQQIHEHPHDIDHENIHHDHEYDSQPIYANIQQTDEILKNDIQHHFHDIIISTLGEYSFSYEHGLTQGASPYGHDIGLRKSMIVPFIIGGSAEIPKMELKSFLIRLRDPICL